MSCNEYDPEKEYTVISKKFSPDELAKHDAVVAAKAVNDYIRMNPPAPFAMKCPSCGYCGHCGRRNPQYQQPWNQVYYPCETATSIGGVYNSSIKATKPAGLNYGYGGASGGKCEG